MTLNKNTVCMALAMIMLFACSHKKSETIVTPWGEVSTDSTSEAFAVKDIMTNGEMIMLTLSGPDTYYDYHGHGMGTQYLLCEKFAAHLGVSVRVELCKDTTEMLTRLCDGEGDLIAVMLPRKYGRKYPIRFCGATVDSLGMQWAVSGENKELADTLNNWYRPSMLTEIQREQRMMFSKKSVRRHTYSPFLNKSAGIISSYDPLFRKYAPVARWDWRLMAAQCYQESCFDPKARSWAGACGLMQIMPATAAHLGLPLSDIYNPEPNIAAAAKFISQLMNSFRDVTDTDQRRLFVLAAYNAGLLHIRDAMALARKNGRNPHLWNHVAPYILGLQTPACYNDPVVKYGYMRGSETVDYVERIRQRYAQYRGVPYKSSGIYETDITKTEELAPYNPMTPRKARKKHRFKINDR